MDVIVAEVRQAHPEHFDGQHIAGWPADALNPEGERKARQFGAWLVAGVAARGICSWWTDELVIDRGTHAESYRVLGWGGGRVWDAANAYNGDSEIVGTAPSSPPATPPGSVPPSPASPTTPVPGACPLPLVVGTWIEPGIGNVDHGPNPTSQRITLGTKWCSERGEDRDSAGRLRPAGWPFECGSKCCRMDTHEGSLGLACQTALFGPAPVWREIDGDVRLVSDPGGNPFNVKVAEGDGTIEACGTVANPGHWRLPCARARVRAQPGPVIQ